MYRRVLPLLLTAVLLLSGCAAGQKNMPLKIKRNVKRLTQKMRLKTYVSLQKK